MASLRGETIGAAYVKILADGSGFADTVRREARKAEPDMEAAGTRSNSAFRRGFDEEENRHPVLTDLTRSIEEGAGKMNALGEFMGSGILDGMRDRLHKKFGPIIGQQITNDLRKSLEAGEIIPADLEHILSTDLRGLARRATASLKDAEHGVSGFAKTTAQMGGVVEDVGGVLGGVFGAGSRNNFFNILGKTVQAPIEMIGKFIGVLGKIPEIAGKVWSSLSQMFGVADEAGSALAGAASGGEEAVAGLGAVGEAGATAAGGLVASGIGALALIPVAMLLVGALSVLVSIISELVGILTAFASVIYFAVVGALSVLIGLLPVAIFGIFGLVAAFAGLDKQTKALIKESLAPLKKEFNDIGDQVRKGLFANLPQQVGLIQRLLKGMGPLFKNIGSALSDMGTQILQGFSDPRSTAFVQSLQRFIPDAIRSLGHIAHNVIVGLGGLFLSLEGPTMKFLGWLRRITRNFANFTTDAANAKGLHKFFDNAWHDARLVFHILGQIVDILNTIFSHGRASGHTMLDTVSDELSKFQKYLDSKEGKRAIDKWFKDAQNLAGQIGDIITSVGKLIDNLDSPDARKAGGALLAGMIAAIKVAIGLVNVLLDLLNIGQQKGYNITHGPISRFGQFHGAAGMLVTGPTRALIGEAGPEAVVPLARPLSQVDPAVRELSAIAQGLRPVGASGGKVINVGGMTVMSPTTDPRIVATEVVNRLVATSY